MPAPTPSTATSCSTMIAMKHDFAITHEFVESVPDNLQEGVVYVSVTFGTVIHKCFCGCDHEVVTPLSPTDWTLIYDGRTVSLDPSIGNWGLPCKSHYWIRRNRVQWAGKWSKEQIDAGRRADNLAKAMYYQRQTDSGPAATTPDTTPAPTLDATQKAQASTKQTLWQRLWTWLFQ